MQSPKCSEEQMAQLGQAFLHASLLGTEAEATRLREIKAEYFRQKQQRAAGGMGCSSLCSSLHVLHGLQLGWAAARMRRLQLSCPSVHYIRHMLHGLQHRLCSSWRLLRDSMAAQASFMTINAAQIAVLTRGVLGPGPCDAFPGQPHATCKRRSSARAPLWLHTPQLSGCNTVSSDPSFAGKANGDGSEANGVEAAADAAAAGAEGASPAAEGGQQWSHRPTLQQTKTQGSGALGNSAARNVVAGVVDEATGGMNAGERGRLCAGASLLKTSWSTHS